MTSCWLRLKPSSLSSRRVVAASVGSRGDSYIQLDRPVGKFVDSRHTLLATLAATDDERVVDTHRERGSPRC
jgi:hypothetical protein